MTSRFWCRRFHQGIREVHVDGSDAGIGKPTKGGACVLGKNSGPRAVAPLAQPCVNNRRPLTANLEADHPRLGSGQTLEKKSSAAGTDFKLDRPAAD